VPIHTADARRSLADAEVVTFCVAQAIMGIPTDERFLKAAREQTEAPVPRLPDRSGYYKRRDRVADTIQMLIGVFASDSPGYHDDLVIVD
jgi:hypothetical protein